VIKEEETVFKLASALTASSTRGFILNGVSHGAEAQRDMVEPIVIGKIRYGLVV